jgi:hypothetical protein
MTIIPDFLRPLIESYLDILLLWFSDYVYQRLLPLYQNHALLRLNKVLDLTPLELACRDFHKQNGQGHPVCHTLPRLVRALLVRYFYDISLRQTETFIREQIPVKWFVGYPLASRGVSYSTVHRFESYLLEHHPRLFLDTVLRQIDAAYPGQRLQPQLADTFAMLANAQLETLIGRLRHAAALLLLTLHRHEPAQFYEITAEVTLPALVGSPAERPEFLLDAAAKQARLSETVSQVRQLLPRVAQLCPRDKEVRRYEAMLRAVLAKEVAVKLDEAGQVVAARQLSEGERGTFRPTSATDPDGTIRNHGQGKQDNGYNIHLAATTDFIREIQATTGSQPDAAGIVPLLVAQKEHHDLRPPKLIYDQAAGHGQTIAAVAKATQGETQLVVKPVQAGKKKEGDRFGPLDCRLREQIDEASGEIKPALVCPGGQMTLTRYRAGSGTGWTYRTPAATCLDCPLLAPCRGTAVQPRHPRQWFISDYQSPVLAALAYSQTEAFKADMKLRPHIERIIAILVLHNGARYARFRTLAKVDFQVKMCAMAFNLKRWLNLSDPHYQTRPRRTAAQAVLRLAAA